MEVRSVGPIQTCKSLLLLLSKPATEDEECSIAMEPISEYRLPFLPEGSRHESVWEDKPSLTKASLPCGHGFNALALMYHLSRNGMTCPICRAGHEGEVMGPQSIPAHLRRAFVEHLEKGRAEDERELLVSDALAAAAVLEQQQEVSFELSMMPLTHVVLILYAYESLDSTESVLALELPLTSSLHQDILEFVSSGFCLRQLALNLRFLPMQVRAFELAVGVRNLLDIDVLLFRTVRFECPAESHITVAARSSDTGGLADTMMIEVQTGSTRNVFSHIEWSARRSEFSRLLMDAAQVIPEMTVDI